MIYNNLLGQCSLNFGEGPYREISLGSRTSFGISSCIKQGTSTLPSTKTTTGTTKITPTTTTTATTPATTESNEDCSTVPKIPSSPASCYIGSRTNYTGNSNTQYPILFPLATSVSSIE